MKLLKNYLSNKIQHVKVKNTVSDPKIFEHGDTQGNILIQLLFNIYINKLFNMKTTGGIHSCADDTVTQRTGVI